MDILILGGTAWIGRELAREAIGRGHRVTCLARGESGGTADGVTFVTSDRTQPGAYDAVSGQDWDAVIEISWQPRFVREAVEALGAKARHWTYISSGSVYAGPAGPDMDESAALLPALEADLADSSVYGEAKVASEEASAPVADRLLVVRAGLIGGPGDHTGRAGYYVARAARDPQTPMLVPAIPEYIVQEIDVRDLVDWILDSAARGLTGVFNASGAEVPFADWIAESRRIGGHTGEVLEASSEWLAGQEVRPYAGPESLPLWRNTPDEGLPASRSIRAAEAEGLRNRPFAEQLTDLLAWETEEGLGRERSAGLSAAREAELVGAFRRDNPTG